MSIQESALKLADVCKDYRDNEGITFDTAHVVKWINQFEEEVREPLLAEVTHILNQTYIKRGDWQKWVKGLASQKKICGDDPCSFWSSTHLLEIQQRGASQSELNKMFQEALITVCPEAQLADMESAAQFVYLDDGIFSGARLRTDVCNWIANDAPSQGLIHVITTISHNGGYWFASEKIKKAISDSGKDLKFKYWNSVDIEDRKFKIDVSDVLRPTHLPQDDALEAYLENECFTTYPPKLRTGNSVGGHEIFSSGENRDLVESQFLIHGARIRANAPNLSEAVRPLGFHSLVTLGFGAITVTFRNCPNNCPLVFWASDPWYPLRWTPKFGPGAML